MDHRNATIRGTGGYLINALKDQPSYFVTAINQERRRRGLPAVPVSGKPWEQLTDVEKRNVQHGQIQDKLEESRASAKLLELETKLAQLKSELGES